MGHYGHKSITDAQFQSSSSSNFGYMTSQNFPFPFHCGSLNITFWNDSNSVAFPENDLISSRGTWEQIETQSGPDKLITFAPYAAAIYRQNYGHLNRSNQPGSYCKRDRKTVRKQNSVLFDAIKKYGLINQHAVMVNSLNLVVNKSKHDISATEFRFDVVRV